MLAFRQRRGTTASLETYPLYSLIILDVYLIFIPNFRDIIIINKSYVNLTFLFLEPKPSVNRLFHFQSSLPYFLLPVVCLSRLINDYIAVYS